MEIKKMKKEFMNYIDETSELDITSKSIEHSMNNAIMIDSLLEILFKNKIIKEKEFRKLVNKRLKKQQNLIIDFIKKIIKDPKIMEKLDKKERPGYVG